jgi:hypothetical protein
MRVDRWGMSKGVLGIGGVTVDWRKIRFRNSNMAIYRR